MIDRPSLHAFILRTLATYGTNTQGEGFRQAQQADHLTEVILQAHELDKVLENAKGAICGPDSPTAHLFLLKING